MKWLTRSHHDMKKELFFMDKNLLDENQISKYFPQIGSYLGDSIEDYYKGIQRIKNKSRSKSFKIN